MRGKMDCHGLTDVGRSRSVNEDQFLVADLNKSMLVHQTSLHQDDHTRLFGGSQGQLLLVADGMGGHAAGEQASAIAVESLEQYMLNAMSWFFRLQESLETDLVEELKAALDVCQKSIETAALINPARQGMGTTLTMAYVLWPWLYVVHAGDSRCYLFRDSRLELITTDHTVAQQLVERGAISPNEAQHSRWSHVLHNCVGGGSHELNAEVRKAELKIGDTILLCTDGLTARVRDEQIVEVLGRRISSEDACHQLVDAANELGGPDNITVVVARVYDSRQPAPESKAEARFKKEISDTDPCVAGVATRELPIETI
ncbi:MAG TPA: protein phosphatase 2C domain-containing protein [Pirellulales bacterium]|nr:protein phosphatase 2C domain-containing protein [Pirellulales bacterium]